MEMAQFTKLIVARENPSSLEHAARTAVAAVVSYLAACLFRLPEAYWAPISTLLVTQSTLGAALPISAQRFAGTAIGAAVGAVTATYFPGNFWAFGVAVFFIGVLCAVLRIERGAYMHAGVTLVIVMLVTRSTNAWRIAIDRFFEVSIGLAVGLTLSVLWPEQQPESMAADERR
jgi:uncharacterized membrane protein YgaE (UPF0421/DUF939 family)